jgi:hypothetical protein
MELYDGLAAACLGLLEGQRGKRLPLPLPGEGWPDAGEGHLVLRGEMAYELGGGSLAAASFFAPCSDTSVFGRGAGAEGGDEAWLYGPDLPELHADAPYARIALVALRDEGDADGKANGAEGGPAPGDAIYRAIREIEHTRYRVNPRGYMARISAAAEREPVRVSREALGAGLDFAKVAGLFIEGYRRHRAVGAVKLVFVTQPDFPFAEVSALAARSDGVTESLDHILKDFAMDCGSCRLKTLCDEVEGMRELHASRAKKAN